MDEHTAWQDATLPADTGFIGPLQPQDEDFEFDLDLDDLESGIASIFAALHAAGVDGDEDNEADDAVAEAHTFQLLGELDRLWQRAS